MATKGYHSYSGRGSRGKVALVVVLVVILLAACTYLLLQPYVVYEDDGSIRLELPFLEKKEEEGETPTDLPEVTEEDIDREEGTPVPPPKAELKALHAQELPYSCLNEDPAPLLEGQSAVVVNLKRFDGSYTYRTELELPQGILQGNGDTAANLEKILAGKAYTTARVSALCDNAYAAAVPKAAIRYESGSWVDYYDRSWLDPKAPETKEYLCDLARECQRLGFDELLLDHFRYPIEGDMTGTNVKEKTDRVQAIHDLTAAIHEAAPGLNVSILLPGSLDNEAAFRLSGLTAKTLTEDFDRIYVPAESDAYYWLDSTLEESYDRSTRLVITTAGPVEGMSYMIAQ